MQKYSKAVVTGYPVGCGMCFSCTPSYPAAYILALRITCSTNRTPGISVTKYEHHYQSHLIPSRLERFAAFFNKRYIRFRAVNFLERILRL